MVLLAVALVGAAPPEVTVGIGPSLGPARREVMGTCLMWPPYETVATEAARLFGGTSVRLWAREDAAWWDRMAPALQALEPCHTLAFVDKSWHPEKVVYNSPSDNNLFAWQQPEAVARRVRFAFAQLRRLGVELEGDLDWEVWNEPQFPVNGAWEPETMARYANDCGRLLHDTGLPIQVGAPLHMGSGAWNESLAAGLDPNLVDFLVNHYYNVGWHKVDEPASEFLRRAGYGPVLRQRVRRDRSLIERYGSGRWSLCCTEWSVHPPNYKPPYHTSRDMAAALYAFSAIKVYLEEGLAAATFFALSGEDGHFRALTTAPEGPIVRPTGAVLGLLNERLHGRLLRVEVTSPSYSRSGQIEGLERVEVPYVEAIAARWEDGSIALLLANKHPDTPAKVRCGGVAFGRALEVTVLTGGGEAGDEARTERRTIDASDGALLLPPASVVAATIDGWAGE